ncbi:MAG: hypothetical protein M1438_16575 [Deltaproteobacteria bacterium]|nr:hypothetical protein [Deltaproteobacteria bacterium]
MQKVINKYLPELICKANENEQKFNIEIREKCEVHVPIFEKKIIISSISFKYKIVPAIILPGPGLDPYLIEKLSIAYEYKNVLANLSKTFFTADLKLGFDTILRAGHFYINPKMEFNYYCERIENGIATLIFVESYQHGELIQAEFTQSIEFQNQFVEISDPNEINRLNNLLTEIRNYPK